MDSSEWVGMLLVGFSAVLLAVQWQESTDRDSQPDWFRRSQARRRTLASTLIGLLGLAIIARSGVPATPWPMTFYLFGLTIGALWVLGLGLMDMIASRRLRDDQAMQRLAEELARAEPNLSRKH